MITRIVFSAFELDALRRLVADGRTMTEIAEKMGYDRATIRREARTNGIPIPIRRRRFTADEDARLRETRFPLTVAEIVIRFPGRSIESLRSRSIRLGVEFRYCAANRLPWTDAERDVVRRNYGQLPVRLWMHEVPGRSCRSIGAIAREMGMRSRLYATSSKFAELSADERAALIAGRKVGKSLNELERAIGYSTPVIRRVLVEEGMMPRGGTKPYYTVEEDDLLRSLPWPQRREDILRLFPGRTVEAVRSRAAKIGARFHLAGNLPKDPATPAEDAIIRANYGVYPLRVWRHLLAHRPVSWIFYRANNALGMKSGLGRYIRRGASRPQGKLLSTRNRSEAEHGSADHA